MTELIQCAVIVTREQLRAGPVMRAIKAELREALARFRSLNGFTPTGPIMAERLAHPLGKGLMVRQFVEKSE